jgi:mycothiol system anti-sigma-R factor
MSTSNAAAEPVPDAQGRAAAEPCGCDEAIERLYEYLDAEIPEPECLRIAAHLAICTSCHDAASAERHVRTLLRRSCLERAPEALRVRVLAEMIVHRGRGAVGTTD